MNMEELDKNFNFDKALQAVEEISDSFKVSIWISSKQKSYDFKEIDAKQQKSLLSNAINSSVYNTTFIKSFYKIMEENFSDKENISDLKEFTIFDKSAIAITLKYQISEETNVIFDEEKDSIKRVNLKNIIEKLKDFQTPSNEIIDLQNDKFNIKLEISVPTIGKELEYEEEIHKKEKNVEDIKNKQDIQKIVSDAFVGETSKYIKNIWLNEENIGFDTFDFSKKIKIVEKLPSGLIQKILQIVSNWKKVIDETLTVEFTENDKTYKKVLSIDSVLFLS